MTRTALRIESVSKRYQLGVIGAKTVQDDLERLWARWRGRPDPLAKVGHGSRDRGDGTSLWALRDVTLDIAAGEVIGLVGRNGAGKSTLLKILSRVTAPTTGEVRVRGRIASLLEVGTGFHPELTGRENIFLNGAILGMTRDEVAKRFDEIVDFSGLAEFVDTPVKRYSSGMYVRLAFAVAAHLECEILLVDEILAVGDAEFQKRCLGKMRDVARQDRTVVFVSHNLSAVSALCQRAVLLEKGQKRAEGRVTEVLAAYAQLIGETQAANLDAVEQRGGSGKARLDNVRLVDERDHNLATLHSGGTCMLDLAYRSAVTLHNTVVYVGIYDALWRRIAFLDSSESGLLPSALPPRGRIRCRIEKLPLPPGTYYANIALKEGGDLVDYVERAIEIEVIEGDFFGTGTLHGHSRACLVDHRWEPAPTDPSSARRASPGVTTPSGSLPHHS